MLTFGIFPGVTGTEPQLLNFKGIYSPARIDEAITQLQPEDGQFLIRS